MSPRRAAARGIAVGGTGFAASALPPADVATVAPAVIRYAAKTQETPEVQATQATPAPTVTEAQAVTQVAQVTPAVLVMQAPVVEAEAVVVEKAIASKEWAVLVVMAELVKY